MYEVFGLLIGCTILAYISDVGRSKFIYSNDKIVIRENQVSKFFLFLLWVVLILFSGLRTIMNDTTVYLSNFSTKVPDSLLAIREINMDIGANPLFMIYQIFIRSLVSNNGNIFLLITSTLVITSYLMFLRKYSNSFGYSIYLLIAFTVYAFTMAAMKQTMAIAIAIWSIPLWMNKKRFKAISIVLVAMLIHPYIIVYFAAFLLTENIWDEKTAVLIMLTIVGGASFTNLIEGLANAASTIGDDYDLSMFTDGQMSIFRTLVYLVVPILSYMYRKQIREKGDKMTFCFINLSIVSTCFVVLARSGGANLFGRMANYFDIFQCISLPMILNYGIQDGRQRRLLKLISIVCFAFFYHTYYSKYLVYGTCFYNHINLLDVLRNW